MQIQESEQHFMHKGSTSGYEKQLQRWFYSNIVIIPLVLKTMIFLMPWVENTHYFLNCQFSFVRLDDDKSFNKRWEDPHPHPMKTVLTDNVSDWSHRFISINSQSYAFSQSPNWTTHSPLYILLIPISNLITRKWICSISHQSQDARLPWREHFEITDKLAIWNQ